MDRLELNNFQNPESSLGKESKVGRPPRHRLGEWFILGPIPGEWISRAAKLPGRALHVALAIWFEAGRAKRATVKLQGQTRDHFGLSRHALYRSLQVLEDAGLILVERHKGRSPLITILPTPGDAEAV